MRTEKDNRSNDNLSDSTRVAVLILLSIASSVCLILLNKAVMTYYNFPFVFFLTGCHFLVSWAGLSLLQRAGIVEAATAPTLELFKIAAAGVASICFMNLSLQHNSVGTYQLMKLLIIPYVIAVELYLGKGTYSWRVLLSLVVLLGGVGLSTVSDVKIAMLGIIVGFLSVASTAHFQIWQGSKQSELKVSSTQLTHLIAPYQTLITFSMSAFSETGVWAHTFTFGEVMLIILTCLFALLVNVCSMALIGKTSAVTYQVVGHSKTCLILILGFVFFPVAAPMKQLVFQIGGIIIAMFGVFIYTYLKLNKM